MPKIYVLNKYGPNPYPHAVEVDTTSRGSFKDLSPFYLGPIRGTFNQRQVNCLRFENLWQYSKVYPCHAKLRPGFDPSNPFSFLPTNKFWEWQRAGFLKSRADRFPMGKGARPLYSISPITLEMLDYINSRKKIYIPIYRALVVQTRPYEMLYRWFVIEGRDLALRDFDGYDHESLGMSLSDVVNNPQKPMGHAFVIKMLLEAHVEGNLKSLIERNLL